MVSIARVHSKTLKLEFTLEQQGSELHSFTYTWIFFIKYM